MNKLLNRLQIAIGKRKTLGKFRTTTPPPTFPLLDFASNDYLGLSTSQEQLALVRSIYDRAISSSPPPPLLGSTGSRLITGTTKISLEVESYIASFHSTSSALLFNSGYAANLSIFSSIPCQHDNVFVDELCHNSILMGLKLGRVPESSIIKFTHNDMSDLQSKITRHGSPSGTNIIATESTFSMDGDVCPLEPLLSLCERTSSVLILDEAHSLGLFPRGLGMASSLQDHPNLLACVNTYGKAFGAAGASITSNHPLRDYLVNYSRPFVYSTAMGLHELCVIRAAYETLGGDEGDRRREKLKKNIGVFRDTVDGAHAKNGRLLPSNSPIQGLVVPGNEEVSRVSSRLNEMGFLVKPIRAPTVNEGEERIRVILHSTNTEDEVKTLGEGIKEVLNF